jgi:hypothetical protein
MTEKSKLKLFRCGGGKAGLKVVVNPPVAKTSAIVTSTSRQRE